MPAWILVLVQTAAAAMLKPMIEALIKSIFDPKAIIHLMLAGGEKLVKSTTTELDDAWFADFKASMEKELARMDEPSK